MPDPAPTSIRRHIPNALTISRIVLAVAFFAVLAGWQVPHILFARVEGPDWRLLLCAGLFVAAAVTDALDGFLARRWKVVSMFGRVVDPVADKVLVLGAFVFLAGPAFSVGQGRSSLQVTGVEPWMVVVVLSRELLVTWLRAVAEARGIAFGADASGKAKMILQSVVVPLILLLIAITSPVQWGPDGPVRSPAGLVIRAVIWLTVLVTAASGIPYGLRAWHALAANPAPPNADK